MQDKFFVWILSIAVCLMEVKTTTRPFNDSRILDYRSTT